ncbi:MAG: nucleotidyltransferase domain-containing protein [Sphingobacteriales bacterium]|nr:nucleotidyltransferase domain-containing protein [Sphingobacteriales bacterium]
MDDFGLKSVDLDRIKEVFDQFPQIEEVIIYGSRAKGNYRAASDIDLTLLGKNIDLVLLNRLSSKLDDLLLPYLFDLSSYQKLDNPELIDHIKRVGKSFYKLNKP